MTDVDQQLRDRGWCRLPAGVPAPLVDRLTRALDAACVDQRRTQIRNGVGDGTDGTVHHLPCADPVFLELLEQVDTLAPIGRHFDGPYILNTFGGLLNRPNEAAYVARVHRDQRTHSGDVRLMVQLLVMLDAFTEENGATFFLDGSHREPQRPADDDFFRRAVRASGDAGSIVMFDSLLWHAAGVNRSKQPRRALTLAFTRPFMKQQLDYPRALGYERTASLSATLQQVLGYNARVPASLDEWYQPPDRRMYRRDQG
jgi:hypothetical protein